MLKKMLLLSVFAVPMLLASEIRFTTPTQIGSLKLGPGLYSIKAQGSMIIFGDAERNKSYPAVANVEKADKKAETTVINGSTTDGVNHVTSITLGGSDQRYVFAN